MGGVLSQVMANIAQVSRRLLHNFMGLQLARPISVSAKSSAVRHVHTSEVSRAGAVKKGENPQSVSNKEWEKRLSPEQYYVCREKGTERPFSGKYVHNHDSGVYCCVCCGAELFSSDTKFDSGCGWPSFWEAKQSDGSDESTSNVLYHSDSSYGMSRIEVLCKQCNSHLGHVFPDGPKPTGERYCINSASLDFEPAEKS